MSTETTAPPQGPAPVAPASGRDRAAVTAWIARNGVYFAIAVLLVLNAVITPNFLTVSNLRLQLIQATPVIIVALGMAMVIGTKGVDLSVGSVMALSAAVMPLYIGYGTVPAILVGIAAGLVTGFVVGILVARAGLQPIVASLAVFVGGRGLANVIGGRIKNLSDPGLVQLGSGSVLGVPYTVLIAAAVFVVVWLLVRRTTFGRGLGAVGGNLRAAQLAGLPIRRILVTVYVLCGVLAALAGVVAAARSQASDPRTLGLLMELNAIAAVVIGGTPLSGGTVRVVGTVAGALLMQLLTATLVAHDVPDSVAQMIQAVVIIAAVWVQLGRRRR